MILKDKAEEHFQEWWTEKYGHFNLAYSDEIHLHAMIIEWLDTVGIYVEISGINHNRTEPVFNYNIQEDGTLNGINGHDFESRQKATESAIKEANEIYNQKHN